MAQHLCDAASVWRGALECRLALTEESRNPPTPARSILHPSSLSGAASPLVPLRRPLTSFIININDINGQRLLLVRVHTFYLQPFATFNIDQEQAYDTQTCKVRKNYLYTIQMLSQSQYLSIQKKVLVKIRESHSKEKKK